MPRSPRGRAVLIAVTLLALLVPGVGHAQSSSGPVPLPDGQWVGTFGAAGVLTGEEEGIRVIWNGRITGDSRFETSGGSLSGDWSWLARVRMDFEGAPFELFVDLTSVGAGPLQGTSSGAVMTGEETTTGAGVADGMSTGSIGPNTFSVDPIDVVFTEVSCNQAIADWTTSLNETATEAELSGALRGSFVASFLGEAIESDLVARIDDLYDRAFAFEARVLAGEAFTLAEVDEAIALVNEALALELEARGTDACVFAEDPGFFATWFTGFVASMVAYLLPLEDWDGPMLEAMVDLLLFAGAVGPGADRRYTDVLLPLIRAELEAGLDRVLLSDEELFAPGGPCEGGDLCVADREGFAAYVRTADRLGIPFETDDGTRYTAAEILEATG